MTYIPTLSDYRDKSGGEGAIARPRQGKEGHLVVVISKLSCGEGEQVGAALIVKALTRQRRADILPAKGRGAPCEGDFWRSRTFLIVHPSGNDVKKSRAS